MPSSPADSPSVRRMRARIAELEAELEALRRALPALGPGAPFYRQLFDALPDAVVVHQDEKVVFANPAAARLIGADSVERIVGTPSLSTVPPEYRDLQRQRRHKVLTERCSLPVVEQQRRRLDGSTIWVETVATFILWEGRPAFLGVLRDITARKTAEAALRDSEEQYRNLLEALPDGVIIHVDRRIVFANRAAVRILGAASKDQLIGIDPRDLIPPEYHAEQEVRRKLVLSRRCVTPLVEQRRRRFDGGEVWVENIGAFTLWQGRPAIIGLLRDVSEKRAAEARAAQLHNWLLRAIDSMPSGFMLWDPDHRLVMWNRHVARYHPAPERFLVGMPFEKMVEAPFERISAMFGPAAGQQWLKRRRRMYREAKGTFEFQGTQGRWFMLTDRRTPDGFTVTLINDVTEHRRNEELLRQGEQRYRTLIDLSPDAIYVHKQGRIVLCNEAAVSMFGAQRAEDLIGRDTLDLVDPEFRPLVSDYQRRAVAAGTRTAYLRQRRRRLNGTSFWAEVAAAAIDWEGERGGIVIVRDISGQIRAEEMMRRSKEEAELASRAKTEFLANISHELRTPLNAIIGFSDLMRREMLGPLGNEQYKAYARDIHQSGTHLHDMINDILDLSKVEAGKADLHEEPMDMAATVRRCLRLLRPRADSGGIALEFRVGETLPALFADVRKVKQVLINLLSNAVKFTEPGGRVTVEAFCDESGRLVLAVEDTGIGMAPEDIPIALQPFGQIDSALSRKYEGTGLGLPLSKSLVELHGGTFDIASAPGKGTRVTVRFPLERVLVPSSTAVRAGAGTGG